MNRRVFTWLAAAALAAGFATSHAEESPVDVVTGAADALAAALRDNRPALEADRAALYAMIDGILEPRFDRRYAAQLVLARSWRSASDDQRAAFIDAFYNAMLRKYADGVLQFDEDRLTVLPFRGEPDAKRATVKTEVVLDDGSTVPVNYGLVRRKAGWKVYDVTIEGISYVRNFRTELAAEINATSLDAVISRLQGAAGDGASEDDSDVVAASGAVEDPTSDDE
ncbi:MAG: ABC transporter substrate-binding protein [Pseudomonadota bacterium]